VREHPNRLRALPGLARVAAVDLASTGMGIASTAPAYSLAATPGFVVATVGRLTLGRTISLEEAEATSPQRCCPAARWTLAELTTGHSRPNSVDRRTASRRATPLRSCLNHSTRTCLGVCGSLRDLRRTSL
jgi:hypothetical protein